MYQRRRRARGQWGQGWGQQQRLRQWLGQQRLEQQRLGQQQLGQHPLLGQEQWSGQGQGAGRG
jgi:hypothetical protein